LNKKNNILLTIILLCATITSAQQHDNIWLFGYESYTNTEGWGGSVMDFSDDTLNIYYEYRDMNLDITNASICDTAGNLLFYTNGIYIANAIHEPMENGGGLNPGEYADDHSVYGYILDQGAIAIPMPESDSLYYLFHLSKDYPIGELSFHSPKFYYSLIDISHNNGLGKVIEKNVLIIEDTLDIGKLTATKHANGKDWWILLREYAGNEYYRILVTREQIIIYDKQEIGESFTQGIAQAVFSPDGSKYAIYCMHTFNDIFLNIFDFDRCTGLLSNPVQAIMADSAWSGGVAISPNSRFLYVSSYNYIYQYDLWADDILSTKDTVAIYDGYEIVITPTFTLPTRFFLMQLGPDGRIYINCPTSGNLLHVINNPDLAGDACDVQQHSIELPTYNLFSLPNFPNYRLGPLPDSACDTTSAIAEPFITRPSVSVFPNPATDQLTLEFEENIESEHELTVYSVTGQRQASYKLPEGQSSFTLDISRVSSGMYFYKISHKGRSLQNGKLMIMKL
jgi:hypothetical protein